MKFFNDQDWKCGDMVMYMPPGAGGGLKGYIIYYEYRPAAPGDRSYAVSWNTGLITTEKAYALRNLTAEERRENKK